MYDSLSSRKTPLLTQVRHHLRLKHYSIRTEDAYVQIIKRFIIFHHKRHPLEMGVEEIRQYLSHLANQGKVSASTQNQALAALLFLYRDVLGKGIGFIDGIERAKRPRQSSYGAYSGRGEAGIGTSFRHALLNGQSTLRGWLTSDGMRAVES